MMKGWLRLRSRTWLTAIAGGALAIVLLLAFWPRPEAVDLGEVSLKAMSVSIDEQARTRVHDPYLVSLPMSGRLLRLEADPGDSVIAGETVIARVAPASPGLLDARSREQAAASIRGAQAAVNLARAEVRAAGARLDAARADLRRSEALAGKGLISEATLERSAEEARSAEAGLSAAEAGVRLRDAELSSAQAFAKSFLDGRSADKGAPLIAPVSGQVLRIMQDSEVVMTAGSPILEIGDVAGDLEIICELLSADAVQVRPGMRVVIEDWGGEVPLEGRVARVEPSGFTKFSALGVEEQRVNVIISFTSPASERPTLGAGFRVEAKIVVWEDEAALTAPSAALFRVQDRWSVFVVEGGRAREKTVEVGRNNGIDAEILGGLKEGEWVIVHPADTMKAGRSVTARR
jgi:HlyD family secretion protein